jgi:hypothetical protein
MNEKNIRDLENMMSGEIKIIRVMENTDVLKDLTLHALKELGEIAEVLIRQDRPDHWKKELGDLCGLCIKPMLELAEMDFETACEIGLERKRNKIREAAPKK